MPKFIAETSNTKHLLQKILEEPQLVSIIQNLPTQVLGKLINHIGLEDAGEIVALSTTPQLEKIFDEDLWRNSRPGQEESFDPKRFTTWLEILGEMGPKHTADKLTEMDEDFICMALSYQLLVVNVDEIALQLSGREEGDFKSDQIEKALECSIGHEFEQFWVLAKTQDAWDTTLDILLSLDENHHDFFIRLMERLNAASNNYIEDNGGLYNVLTNDEQLQSDVAFDRELRREKEGFVSPQSAANFLKLAASTELDEILKSKDQDPITRSYFKNYGTSGSTAPAQSRKSEDNNPQETSAVTAFINLLQEAEVLPAQERVLLLQNSKTDKHKHQFLEEALGKLADGDLELHSKRIQELSYLANILISGKSHKGRRFRPNEAAEEALTICEIGLKYLNKVGASSKDSDPVLKSYDFIKLFRLGWNIRSTESK